MAKQSPKDPKFRCNVCKEYFYASKHPVHYQCPQHGYLCQKHIGIKGQLVYGHDARNNPIQGYSMSEYEKPNPDKNPFFDKVIKIPFSLIDKCLCTSSNGCDPLFLDYNVVWFKKDEQQLEKIVEMCRCKKKPAKFIWNKNIERWLEEGKDKEEDFVKQQNQKPKSIANNANAEIKLLVDLFEKDILDKSQFLEQLKSKL